MEPVILLVGVVYLFAAEAAGATILAILYAMGYKPMAKWTSKEYTLWAASALTIAPVIIFFLIYTIWMIQNISEN